MCSDAQGTQFSYSEKGPTTVNGEGHGMGPWRLKQLCTYSIAVEQAVNVSGNYASCMSEYCNWIDLLTITNDC